MNTFILNAESVNMPVGRLFRQIGGNGLEVRDADGNVIALVLSPAAHEAWTYAEADRYIDQHRDEILRSLGRTNGITTAELLKRAEAAGRGADEEHERK